MEHDRSARLSRLEAALAALEQAAARVAAAERSRADLADSLALLEEDRQRLARELDHALARAQKLEDVNHAVQQRLDAACVQLAALLAEAEAP